MVQTETERTRNPERFWYVTFYVCFQKISDKIGYFFCLMCTNIEIIYIFATSITT